MKTPPVVLGFSFALASALSAGQWPAWRGDGTGISTDKALPQTWSANANVRWRVELPERSNASPIVWGDRIFLNQAQGSRRTLMCLDRGSGKVLWQSGTTYQEREPSQRDNPYCSATPATDGERVVVSFGSAGLYCYDFAGKELWHRDFGRMSHQFGNASSPVLVGEVCVFFFGPDEKARLIAVNKKTGATLWEAAQPQLDPSEMSQRGGFGPRDGGNDGPPVGRDRGSLIGNAMLAQGDKDANGRLSAGEFSALAETWWSRFDSAKAGSLSGEKFSEKLGETLAPRAEGEGPSAGFIARFIAPRVLTATDANNDATLTRDEWTAAFTRWFAAWDSDKAGTLDEPKLRAGLASAMPLPGSPSTAQAGPRGGFGGGPGGFGGRGGGSGGSSWATPLVVTRDGRAEVLMSFPNRLVSYDPATGRELWQSKGMGATIYTSPAYGDGAIYTAGSGPGGGSGLAVKPGGDVLWKLDRVKSTIGSGVIHDGHLFTVSQEGIAECVSLADGRTMWSERLRGSGARGGAWSSLLLADGKVYAPNQSGDVFVLRAAPKFELLATNSVGEPTNASLAAADGAIYLRTDRALWCFAAQ
jgi:outer membrane protein assembly factor BamB